MHEKFDGVGRRMESTLNHRFAQFCNIRCTIANGSPSLCHRRIATCIIQRPTRHTSGHVLDKPETIQVDVWSAYKSIDFENCLRIGLREVWVCCFRLSCPIFARLGSFFLEDINFFVNFYWYLEIMVVFELVRLEVYF